jgi:hypothetical protein
MAAALGASKPRRKAKARNRAVPKLQIVYTPT